MLNGIDEFLGGFSGFLWGYILLFCLLGTHLYLTLVLRFPQRYLFRAMSYYFKRSGEGHISHFASLMVSLAANVGTGNIIGVAVAVSTGGPGAVFWCMVTGLLGMATRYAECLLAIRYRRVDALGHLVGGPMYVLEHGLHCKWLAVVFAVLTAIAAFGIGNLTQANAVSAVLQESALNIPTWATATVLCILVAAVLLGGLRGIAHTCKACVPTMALVYAVGCVLVLAAHADFILPAIQLIFDSAFSAHAATGGFIGSTLMLAMRTGVQRGLFSNEAGMGSTPHAHALANVPTPHHQGCVAMIGVFIDTFVVLPLNALVIICTLYRLEILINFT